jgi:hypothetical protein
MRLLTNDLVLVHFISGGSCFGVGTRTVKAIKARVRFASVRKLCA